MFREPAGSPGVQTIDYPAAVPVLKAYRLPFTLDLRGSVAQAGAYMDTAAPSTTFRGRMRVKGLAEVPETHRGRYIW